MNIRIKGARVNNLKNITLDIPRDKFIVITGISGSGKSSLAFDTLFAEGQRRFAQSLSSYARQFLGRMSKPDVDLMEGIPPAIAIEQKVNVKNPRSTVATTTEIYDYLRLVFARIGRIYSPVTGEEVRCWSPQDVLGEIRRTVGSVLYVAADIGWSGREDKVEQMLALKEDGFTRFLVEGQAVRIEDVMKRAADGDFPKEAFLLVDRVKLPLDSSDEALESRLLSSLETAFERGGGSLLLCFDGTCRTFLNRFEADGISFSKPDEFLFSFNSPLGACPVCGGLGKIIGVSEDLVVPDKSLSIYDGAIACWRGEKMDWFKQRLILCSEQYGIPIFEPYHNLSAEQRRMIWEGRHGATEEDGFPGIDEFFKWVESNRYKIQYRFMLNRYSGRTECAACGGSRLRKEALWVRVGGRNIAQLLQMNVDQMLSFFENFDMDEYERSVAARPVEEIISRLRCIRDVGLSYLTLDRPCNTLSGGESQRVNLVTALGSTLVGSMYILDEPSIGLHPRDTERLIAVLKRLRDIGNTVVVVEHDEEIIRAADQIIDMGPLAGQEGGEVVFQGAVPGRITESGQSLTLQYLSGERGRYARRKLSWTHSICVNGAMQNNLKDINVTFPLGVLTVVSGVSGSGKSSLVGDILYPALYRHINETGEAPGTFRGLSGDLSRISRVEYVNQNPIGKSSRSNAVTYLKVYDDIRRLLSEQQAARISGFDPSYFSFNQDGGRCPECQGEGFVKVGMQFMADVTMICEACGGKRFKPDVLEVRYHGKNVDDILAMRVDEAIEFFSVQKDMLAKRIAKRLQPLVDVGLSYISLGQSSSTLSGGESQRIKLAYFLSTNEVEASARKNGPIMFIFDEPTTGLHFYDVEKLLRCFDVLLSRGHTVVVVEHNLDVIRNADWLIELGPDAGDAGGLVVYAGPVEGLAKCKESQTLKYL